MNKHQIEAERYLSRAFKINVRIRSKTKLVQELRELATKATATLSDLPKAPSKSTSRVEDVVVRIVDLQADIQKDVNELVELERDIIVRIRDLGPDNARLQTVLELRYFDGRPWADIAETLGCGLDNAYYLHRRALSLIKIPEGLK